MTRREELDEIFRDVDDGQKRLVSRLIDEVIYLEGRMADLKAMPFISIHPKYPEHQRSTPAARQYKECSQSYMNAVRILLSILAKVETSAQDELMRRLEEFM